MYRPQNIEADHLKLTVLYVKNAVEIFAKLSLLKLNNIVSSFRMERFALTLYLGKTYTIVNYPSKFEFIKLVLAIFFSDIRPCYLILFMENLF